MAYYHQGGPQMNYGARPHQGDMFPGVSQGDFGENIELEETPSFEAHHVHFHNEHFEPPQGIKTQNIPMPHRNNKAILNLQPTTRQAEYFSNRRDVSDEVSHAEFRPMQDSGSSVAQFSRYPMKTYSMDAASSRPAPMIAPVVLQEVAAQPEPEALPMDFGVASNAAYCDDELDEPSGIDLTDFVSLHDMMAVRRKLDVDLGLVPPKYMGTSTRGIPQLTQENDGSNTTKHSNSKRKGLRNVWRQLKNTFRRR